MSVIKIIKTAVRINPSFKTVDIFKHSNWSSFPSVCLPSFKLFESANRAAFSTMSSDEGESKSRPSAAGSSDQKEGQSDLPKRYGTRGNVLTEQNKSVQAAKDRILSMDIGKKRKLYKLKGNYVELDSIPVWPQYFADNITEKWWKTDKKEVVADINADLNEKLSIFVGDITALEIDAIVNAANESLLGGGGVDGAIHRAAGKDLLMECELLNGCKPGGAKITCGYNLPAKHVIHTVGPRGERPAVLEECYTNCLDLVRDNNLKTIAFPCISTGIFGYPNLNAAKVVLKTVRHWLDSNEYADKIERIIFCLFLDKDVDIYNEQLQLYFPIDKDSAK